MAGDCNVHCNFHTLSQHALGDCTIKFESNSFRILLSAGYSSFEPFDAVEDAVSSQQSAVKV